MTIVAAYTERAPDAPTDCPCLSCRSYGPYCADACALYDAWIAAGRPGRTSIIQAVPDNEQPHGR